MKIFGCMMVMGVGAFTQPSRFPQDGFAQSLLQQFPTTILTVKLCSSR